MWEALLGKLLSWIPAPWSGVRLGQEATARLFTSGHPLVLFVGDPPSRGLLHMHVSLKLWSRRGETTTVRAIQGWLREQGLDVRGFLAFKEMTLEPGASPEEQDIELHAPKGQVLLAGVGDVLNLKLMLTRGRSRTLKLPIRAEKASLAS
jgi:hypothetical protein